jgi:hypothetical protein
MMNPFIQRALDDVHTYPASSASLTNTPSTSLSDEKWALKRFSNGGLMVDDFFRVKLVPKAHSSPILDSTKSQDTNTPEATMHDVFALGDVTVMEKARLPATAQVANQEAKWLGKHLNKGSKKDQEGFTFKNLGVMTYLGNKNAIMQTGGSSEIKG